MNTIEAPAVTVSLCMLLTAIGIVFHFVSKLGELESRGQIVTPWEYWRGHPYTSLAVIMAAYLVTFLQWQLGELGLVGSIMNGIACNALGDKLRATAEARAQRSIDKAGGP